MPKRLIVAVALWTVAGGLMASGVIQNVPAMRGTAILVGLMACVPSVWLVAEHEREETVRSIARILGYAQADEKVRLLH